MTTGVDATDVRYVKWQMKWPDGLGYEETYAGCQLPTEREGQKGGVVSETFRRSTYFVLL